MNSRSREEILHKIRQGLTSVKDPAPMRSETIDFCSEAQLIKKGLTKRRKSLVKQFITEVESVNSTVLGPEKPDNIYQVIYELTIANNLKSFSIWETNYLKQLDLKNQLKSEGLKLVTAKNKNRLAGADIGITEADYAIADTGTLVLLTDKDKPRGVSLLPPIHMAVVKPENIVSNIRELFVLLKAELDRENDIKSCMTFITGPSRTADIELNLTLGVHGPKELYILIA